MQCNIKWLQIVFLVCLYPNLGAFMFTFLVYLFLFYIIFRMLFGRINSSFKAKVFRFDTRNQYHQQEENNEGSITINPKIQSNKKSGTFKGGDYADFEEVK